MINGGLMKNYQNNKGISNVILNDGQFIVIEADESDGSIEKYNPYIAVINNIGKDHKELSELKKLFFDFAKRSKYAVVNLDTIQKAVDAGKLSANAIDLLALMNAGIVSQAKDGLRLLARGAITTSINITVNAASKAAVAAVEKAGGKVSVIEVSKEAE